MSEKKLTPELVRSKILDENPGIPSVSKINIGARCTLAIPVHLSHSGSPCLFCKKAIGPDAKIEACPERAPIVGHYHKVFKVSAIRDGGDTVILKRVG